MAAKDTYYFSHDYNARNDEKVLELRAQYGAEGYGIYWMLIETMAENNMIIDARYFGGISLNLNLDKGKLTNIIDFCLSIGLFHKKGDNIYSKRLNRHKEFRNERSASGKKGAEKKWDTVRERKEEFKIMAAFFDNTCVKCEGQSGLSNVECDHIIPKYQGGKDEITNYQPLCARCNASKGPDSTDYRIRYAEKHGLAIPKKWLSHALPNSKEKKGKESKGKEKKENSVFTPPPLSEVIEYFLSKGYTQQSAERAYEHYNVAGWKDVNGKPVINWRQKMNTVWFKPENLTTQNTKKVVW